MSEHEPQELAPWLRSLLDAERNRPADPHESIERMVGMIATAAGLPLGPPADLPQQTTPPAPISPDAGIGTASTAIAVTKTATIAATIAKPASIAIAFALGGVTGAGVHHQITAQKDPIAMVATVSAPHQTASAVRTPDPLTDAGAPGDAAVDALDGTVAPPARPILSSVPALRDRALREERTLLDRAATAVLRGRTSDARAALQEHATRFSNGQLKPERDMLLRRLETSDTPHE